MRVKFSPLVDEAAGKIGPMVVSSWHGRPLIKAYEPPSNPDTAAQQAVRESYGRCAELWQSLLLPIPDTWEDLAIAEHVSPWNEWIRANRAQEQDGFALTTTPYNPDLGSITNLNAVASPPFGRLLLTWTDPGLPAGTWLYILVREWGTNVLWKREDRNTLASAGTKVIGGLVPLTWYDVYVSTEPWDQSEFGESVFDFAKTS